MAEAALTLLEGLVQRCAAKDVPSKSWMKVVVSLMKWWGMRCALDICPAADCRSFALLASQIRYGNTSALASPSLEVKM